MDAGGYKYFVYLLYLNPAEPDSDLAKRAGARLRKIAPFLKLDADALSRYLSEGKLYLDTGCVYHYHSQFPYSNPRTANFESGLNYIRNSVKVVVDMYDGTVSFYIDGSTADPVLEGLPAGLSLASFKDLNQAFSRSGSSPALSAGSVRNPGDTIPELSYDRSSGLLQSRRSVGAAAGESTTGK